MLRIFFMPIFPLCIFLNCSNLLCIFNWVFYFLIEFWMFFIYFRYYSFVKCVVCKYFLLVCSLSFHPLNRIFWSTDVFNFDKIQFISLPFMGSCFWCQVSELCLVLNPTDFLLCVFLKVLCFTFIYFKFYLFV